MTTLTNRAVKGSRLTTTEGDNNWKRQAQAKTTTYSVVVGDNRDTIECSGTFTVTLPDAASIVSSANTGDFRVNLVNSGSGTITVARTTGTDTINGTAANITLLPGECAPLKVNQAGNGYNLDSGTNVLLGLTASVTELNRSDITTEGTVEASKVVTADSSGYITHDASSVEKRMYWNGSSKQSYFYALPNGDFGYFDQQNTRIIWNYDESDNEVDFVSGINASGGVTGNLTGDVTGNVTGNIVDSNSNEVVIYGETASAVNEVTVTNAATGSGPTISATGGDPDVNLSLTSQGDGYVRADGGSSGEIQGIYVGLDTPVVLTTSITPGSWQTLTFSGYPDAKAVEVIMHCRRTQTNISGGFLYLRKTGSGLPAGNSTIIGASTNNDSGNSTTADAVGTSKVNLNGSQQFDYYSSFSAVGS